MAPLHRLSSLLSALRGACLIRSRDSMTTIAVRKPGRLELSFQVNATSALAAVGGSTRVCDLH